MQTTLPTLAPLRRIAPEPLAGALEGREALRRGAPGARGGARAALQRAAWLQVLEGRVPPRPGLVVVALRFVLVHEPGSSTATST